MTIDKNKECFIRRRRSSPINLFVIFVISVISCAKIDNSEEKHTKDGSKGSKEKNKNRNRNRDRDHKVAQKICQALGEKKLHIMLRVVRGTSHNFVYDLLHRVQQIEIQGGMPTKDGSRRRTSGGIFFTLLKEQVSPVAYRHFFEPDIEQSKKTKRINASKKRKRQTAQENDLVECFKKIRNESDCMEPQ